MGTFVPRLLKTLLKLPSKDAHVSLKREDANSVRYGPTPVGRTHFEVQYLTRDDIYDHKQDMQRAYAGLFDTTDPYGRDKALVADTNPSSLLTDITTQILLDY